MRFHTVRIVVMALLLSMIGAWPSLAQNPIKSTLSDPIFVNAPDLSNRTIQNKDAFTLDFRIDNDRCKDKYGDNYYAKCQRATGMEGKKAETGIAITPPIRGEWRWNGDYDLTFTPSETWKAGQDYSIAYDLDALGVPLPVVISGTLRKETSDFKAADLEVKIVDMKYMQDPDDPKRKLVSAHVTTNYPAKTDSLNKAMRLEYEAAEDGRMAATPVKEKPEIKNDPDHMGAWVSVSLSTLPDKERYLRLIVDAGVEPEHGGSPSPDEAHERTRIPSLDTYLAVSDSAAVIARQEDDTPQQILSFQTNVKAKPDDVLRRTHLYLLPAQHPVTKLNKDKTGKERLYEWKASNEVTPEILKQSEALPLQPMKNGDKDVTQFGFQFTAPSQRYLYPVVDKGLMSFGGYTLGRPFENILRAPEWPHDLDIMQEGSILTLSGARKLSLQARGTDSLKIEVAHIRTEALQHFISQTRGDIRNPSFVNYDFGKDDIAKIDSKDLPMAFKAPQDSQYATFDFAPYMKDNSKGLFLLSIQGYKDGKQQGDAAERFVLVTDFGLLVKQNARAGRDVFLMSFTSGQPVDAANITVLGRNGVPVFTGVTAPDGHVALPDFAGFTKDREPVAIVAQKSGDYAFIPYEREDRELNMSRFDVGGAMASDEGLRAMLFSDRGIYRPGETVHIGAILRNTEWTALPPGLPLRMIVTDPRNRKVKDQILKFNDPGMQELSFDTGESWPTGTYRANLYIAKDDTTGSLLGSTSVKVQEFQPDRLKIKTVFTDAAGKPVTSKGWIKPDGLQATVDLTNLYGLPASDRRITGAVTLSPTSLHFDAFKDYSFFDSAAAKSAQIQYNLPDAKTDAKGHVVLPLNLNQQPPATYNLNLQTQGFEAGSGRGVTAYAEALVSPIDYAVGYRSDANLGYLKKGQPYTADLVAINPQQAQMALDDLTLDLVHKSYVSTLVKRNDGSYAYESVAREENVKSAPFEVSAAGSSLDLPTAEIGDFIYRVKNKKGETVAEIPFSVAGEGQRMAGADKEAVLKVSINKDTYGPGDSIELNITAPYTGAGLITLESDHVIAYKWFRTDKTDTIQTIPVPKDFSGKGYVNVAFVRDINSREIYMSPLSYSVVPFTANLEARTEKIELTVPALVKPGQPVTVHYKGNASGKAVIYAVDEGILQVAKYKTPDPVHFFLLDRALQVRTMQMLDLLMPEYALIRKLSHIGGDMGDEASLGKHLNPFKRRTLAPAIFWSGIVDIDTSDRTVTFTPPGHFNGEMRVMAVAVSNGGVGSAEDKITVRGDLVVTPNVPVFMAPGDEAHVSATIANGIKGSGKDAKLSMTATATLGLTVAGLPPTLAVPEGQERSVDFILKATANPGPASITVSVTQGALVQKAEATLSVRPATPKETTLTSGYAEKGNANIKLTRALYPAFASREAAVAPLPTAYIFGLLRYLDEYPYGCSEQIVSKAFPQLSLIGQSEFAVKTETMQTKVAEAVSALRRRQTPDGGFSYWDGENEANDFITIYALDFLTRAREANQPVPSEMVENGLRYLRDRVNNDVGSLDDTRTKAYGIYVMTSNGIVTTNEILHLLKYFDDHKDIKWQTDLTALYIAASYQLMQQGEMATQTLDAFAKGVSADDVGYTGWDKPDYNPFIKYARYISLLSRHFPDRLKTLDPQIVFKIATYIQEQRYNTQSSAFAVQALLDYQKAGVKALSAQDIQITADGSALPGAGGAELMRKDIPVDATTIGITGAKSPIFYTVTESGFDKTVTDKPVSENLNIDRTYTKTDGTPLDKEVNTGDVVDAAIKISSQGGREISNIAIVDLLPGGFELDLDDNGGDSTFRPVFVDKREDRIIAFGTATPTEQTFHYRMRATAKGTFIVPPPYAESMYDLTTKARGHAGTITVKDKP